MNIVTKRLTVQGRNFTSDKVETPIGWLKYASDTDDVLNHMVQEIYDTTKNNLLNITITPFVGLLERRLFVPVSYTIVYTVKIENDDDVNT